MKHLSDEQLAGWLAGEAEPETRLHLESCPQCSAEAVELRDGISRYSIAMRRQAASAQATHMSRNFAPSKVVTQHRMRWVGAGVLALLLAGQTVWLVKSRPARRTAAQTQTPSAGQSAAQLTGQRAEPSADQPVLSDDELLEAVNNDLSREVPLALAPVSTITTERNRMAASAVAAPGGNATKE